MTNADVMLLVGIWGEADPYASAAKVTEDKANTWHAILASGAPGMTFVEARDLMVAHYVENPGKTFEVGHLIAAWRKRVAADVRAARAMRLVPGDWSERRPLPSAVSAKLAAARANAARAVAELTAGENPVDNSGEVATIIDAVGRGLTADWK